MSHLSKGWTCFHYYMHDGCVAGYVCNHTVGQCQLGKPGEGDTKANCQKTCTSTPPPPSPTPQYICNVSTFTCEESPSGTAPIGTCSSACSNSTPSAMFGLWRGISVQTNFSIGSWLLNFSQTTVAWGPYGQPHMYEAHVAQLSPVLLRLTHTSPTALAGLVRYASFSTPGWPTGPETRSVSIAIQNVGSHQAPPDNPADAMGQIDFDVFVMHACDSWKAECNFARAFHSATPPVEEEEVAFEAAAAFEEFIAPGLDASTQSPLGSASDACTANKDCSSCIDDPLKVCGWCDGIITFGDGTTCGGNGTGCCGGASGFSHCNVAYRKTCPVVCDWSNYTSPFCREATSKEVNDPKVQKFEDCDIVQQWGACKYVFGHYCDNVTGTCKEIGSKAECIATPGCDPNNPTCDAQSCISPSKKMYYYCSASGCAGPLNKTACEDNPECDPAHPTCDPTKCSAPPTHYVCDAITSTCKPGSVPGPTYNTSTECEKVCYNHEVDGVWRGIRIDADFVADEWDFVFTKASGSVRYHSKLQGKTYTGTYSIGSSIQVDTFASFHLTITLASGEVLKGIYDNHDEGPITKYMYLGTPLVSGQSVSDYDGAMAPSNQEFVLVACKPNLLNCDFSRAAP